ncbi:MAG: MOSC domain-containing protein [Rhodospirillales bacterium]
MSTVAEAPVSGLVRRILIVPEGTDAETSIASKDAGASVNVGFEGFPGEVHSGLTRNACVRVRDMYDKGTNIRNVRQISIISEEDMAVIAEAMEIERIEPEWLGANMLVSGIPHFTLLPPATRLLFDGGASLVIDTENAPCAYPAKEIEKAHPGKGKLFVKNARQRRGVTAWVEKEGSISAGDSIRVFIPRQPAWPGAAQD